MDELFSYQSQLLARISDRFKRYMYEKLPWNERFVCIKGLRGVGKTTMMLQYLKYGLKDTRKNLYVTMDHPYFYSNSLLDLANEFSLAAGKVLFVDEVHKVKGWSRMIKNIYDTYPDIQLVISASSALDLLKGEADLSRRVVIFNMGGLSFREYLAFVHDIQFERVPLQELLKNHLEIASKCLNFFKPIPFFKEYLISGYYPFATSLLPDSFQTRLMQTLDTTLNVDMAYINDYSPENTYKIKKLLGVIVESPPFSINISVVAEKLGISRNTVKSYLHAMEFAGVLNFLNRAGKGISILQKPDKIYLENTNLSYMLRTNNEIGNIRETFMINQLIHAGLTIEYPKEKGDIYLPQDHVFLEIGGKSKGKSQIENFPNAFVAADDLEVGYLNKIPLYLFGFLY